MITPSLLPSSPSSLFPSPSPSPSPIPRRKCRKALLPFRALKLNRASPNVSNRAGSRNNATNQKVTRKALGGVKNKMGHFLSCFSCLEHSEEEVSTPSQQDLDMFLDLQVPDDFEDLRVPDDEDILTETELEKVNASEVESPTEQGTASEYCENVVSGEQSERKSRNGEHHSIERIQGAYVAFGADTEIVSQSESEKETESPQLDSQPPVNDGPTELSYEHFEVLEKLGEGGNGSVYRAFLPAIHSDPFFDDVKEVAMKFVPFSSVSREEIRQEVILHQKVNGHHRVLNIYDYFDLEDKMVIVLEKLDGGDLGSFLNRFGCVPEKVALLIFENLMSAIVHLHEYGVAHLDIKPENLMIERKTSAADECLDVKLIDFGLAQDCETEAGVDEKWNSVPTGTAGYAPPELVLEDHFIPSRADVFECGATLFDLLTGRTPYHISKWSDYEDSKFFSMSSILDALPSYLSMDTKHLLVWCLQKDPDLRPSSTEALEMAREIIEDDESYSDQVPVN